MGTLELAEEVVKMWEMGPFPAMEIGKVAVMKRENARARVKVGEMEMVRAMGTGRARVKETQRRKLRAMVME